MIMIDQETKLYQTLLQCLTQEELSIKNSLDSKIFKAIDIKSKIMKIMIFKVLNV